MARTRLTWTMCCPFSSSTAPNCHGNDKQKGDLNLATYAAMQAGRFVRRGRRPRAARTSRGSTCSPATRPSRRCRRSGAKIPDAQIALLKLWIEQGAQENAGSKVNIPAMPKTDIGLKSVVKGRPEGAPPMPALRQAEARPVSSPRDGPARCSRWPPARGHRSSPSAGRSRSSFTTPTPARSSASSRSNTGRSTASSSRATRSSCWSPVAAAGSRQGRALQHRDRREGP